MILMRNVLIPAIIMVIIASSCSKDVEYPSFTDFPMGGMLPGQGGMGGDTEGATTIFDKETTRYNGEKATDGNEDIVGSDEDIYWEANNFSEKVKVVYSEVGATVTTTNQSILYHVKDGYVTIDMKTNSVKNVEVVVSGKSSDGQLKLYGEKKFKLTLDGVDLTCATGPAINDQCKKRVFIHLADNTVNSLVDSKSYSDEPYYLDGSTSDDEDRKGCFFSEGNIIFSGTGSLLVEGKKKHGIATDGYMYMRPGVTIAVNEAAKNAIHVKGDADEGIGICIKGGLIYANTSSTAGKCLKTDSNISIEGGQLLLNTSGGAEYDSDEKDTSSAACIKSDGNTTISAGTHVLKSTGTGGKGLNVDGNLDITGGETTVITSGGKYVYNEALDLTSSPKGVKADGNISINGGKMNIEVSGVSDGSEGLESKSAITINDGDIYIYAYDDAMNASNDITINGGRVYCYAVNNDGIDSNGTLNVTGGLVISSGASGAEEGFDCDRSDKFIITGGTLIGTGGSAISPSNSSTQCTVIYNGITPTMGSKICILDSKNKPIMTYELPRTNSGMSLFFSSPELVAGDYTVSMGGDLSDSTDSWFGWYQGGKWSGGSQVGTFTSNSIVTTVGSTMGGIGGFPGGFGGHRW